MITNKKHLFVLLNKRFLLVIFTFVGHLDIMKSGDNMRKKEDLRILKTKACLYRGLMNLMKTKPFEDIKISEICKESLINRSTFYDHFNDKYELIESLMNDMRKELVEKLNKSIKTNNIKEYYIELMKILLDHIKSNIDIYSSAIKINSNSIARDMMTEVVITSATKEIDERYENKSDIPTKKIVLYYASGIINIIIESINNKKQFDTKELIHIIDELTPDLNYFIAINN